MGAPSIRPDLTFQLSWRGSLETRRRPSSRRLQLHQGLLFRRLRPSFVAMTLLIILRQGSAIGIVYTEGSAWVLWVSLTSGFAVATLSYAFSTCSNQSNCAVTFVFVAVAKFPPSGRGFSISLLSC